MSVKLTVDELYDAYCALADEDKIELHQRIQFDVKKAQERKRAVELEQAQALAEKYGMKLVPAGEQNMPAAKPAKFKAVAMPKYQDPVSGKTWAGGKGAQPKWVKAHLEAGGSLDDLLIDKTALQAS